MPIWLKTEYATTLLEDNSRWTGQDVLIVIIIIMRNHIGSLRITISRWLSSKSLVLGKPVLQGSLQLSLQLDRMRLPKLFCPALRTGWPVVLHGFPTAYINLYTRYLLTSSWNTILHDHLYSCCNSFYWVLTRPVWWAGTTWGVAGAATI